MRQFNSSNQDKKINFEINEDVEDDGWDNENINSIEYQENQKIEIEKKKEKRKNKPFPERAPGEILSRFFVKETAHLFRNTLSKFWWVRYFCYNENLDNKFEVLDNLGANDISTKVKDLFYSYGFSKNKQISLGISRAWKSFSNEYPTPNVRKHFKMALQKLNLIGGGIFLDVLSADDIEKIFYQELYRATENK